MTHFKFIKNGLKKLLLNQGYCVRDIGNGVGGVDIFYDTKVLIGDSHDVTLFDVGANIGQTTLAMRNRFRQSRIISFEPSPKTFEILEKKVGRLKGVKVEQLALGAESGKMPFHVTRDHSVNDSLLCPKWDAGGAVTEVCVETVDNYCSTNGLRNLGLLKIDAQGYDLQVLLGARKMLESGRIKAYCCEANFEQLYDGQASLRDLLAFADEIKFRLVGFYEQTYVRDRLSYMDALFIQA